MAIDASAIDGRIFHYQAGLDCRRRCAAIYRPTFFIGPIVGDSIAAYARRVSPAVYRAAFCKHPCSLAFAEVASGYFSSDVVEIYTSAVQG